MLLLKKMDLLLLGVLLFNAAFSQETSVRVLKPK